MNKEMERDLDVFINDLEFAEEITLNGRKLQAVVLRHNGNPNLSFKAYKEINPGTHGMYLAADYVTLYFKEAEFADVLNYGESIEYNGRKYRIEEIKTALGMRRLVISAELMRQVLSKQMLRRFDD